MTINAFNCNVQVHTGPYHESASMEMNGTWNIQVYKIMRDENANLVV